METVGLIATGRSWIRLCSYPRVRRLLFKYLILERFESSQKYLGLYGQPSLPSFNDYHWFANLVSSIPTPHPDPTPNRVFKSKSQTWNLLTQKCFSRHPAPPLLPTYTIKCLCILSILFPISCPQVIPKTSSRPFFLPSPWAPSPSIILSHTCTPQHLPRD